MKLVSLKEKFGNKTNWHSKHINGNYYNLRGNEQSIWRYANIG